MRKKAINMEQKYFFCSDFDKKKFPYDSAHSMKKKFPRIFFIRKQFREVLSDGGFFTWGVFVHRVFYPLVDFLHGGFMSTGLFCPKISAVMA